MAFQLVLVSIETGKAADLVALDAEICSVLGVKCDPTEWYVSWMSTVGMMLAIGHDYAYVRDAVEEYYYEIELRQIIDYLETYYRNESHFCR